MYRCYTTSVTEQFGAGLTHEVYDRDIVPMSGGPLRAACGRYITPAPLSAPIGRPCPACIAQLSGRWSARQEQTAIEPRDCTPLLRRLFGW